MLQGKKIKTDPGKIPMKKKQANKSQQKDLGKEVESQYCGVQMR